MRCHALLDAIEAFKFIRVACDLAPVLAPSRSGHHYVNKVHPKQQSTGPHQWRHVFIGVVLCWGPHCNEWVLLSNGTATIRAAARSNQPLMPLPLLFPLLLPLLGCVPGLASLCLAMARKRRK